PWPDARSACETGRTCTVDDCLDSSEDGALRSCGRNDFAPAFLLVGCLRRIALVRDGSPETLEEGSGQDPAENAEEQTERFVDEFRHRPGFFPGSAANNPCGHATPSGAG